jgi:hypothetical protein
MIVGEPPGSVNGIEGRRGVDLCLTERGSKLSDVEEWGDGVMG